MRIEIKIDKEEVDEIIKAHVLANFPINVETHDTSVEDYYGGYKAEITEKVPAKEPEMEEAV